MLADGIFEPILSSPHLTLRASPVANACHANSLREGPPMRIVRSIAATDLRRHRRTPRALGAFSDRGLRDVGFVRDDLGRAERVRA
jgi:uncharacterized protein YjiS (DUF1127 family)